MNPFYKGIDAEILIPCILSVPKDGSSLTELVLISTLDNDLENSTINI